jgi:ERCC4-type nuclease
MLPDIKNVQRQINSHISITPPSSIYGKRMVLELVIDNREKSLIRLFQQHPRDYVHYRNLDYGDCLITWQGQERIIMERKTHEDLASSIKDGRYSEQKTRLFKWRADGADRGRRRLVYIIEGSPPSHPSTTINGIPYTTLTSSMLSMTFRDNIDVLTTKDVNETYALLDRLLTKLLKDPDDYFHSPTNVQHDAASYFDSVKLKKNKNITPDNIFILQLAQIPGISSKIAHAIHRQHPTMSHFISELLQMKADERVAYVTNLKLGSDTTRRVGPKTAQTILNFLKLPVSE